MLCYCVRSSLKFLAVALLALLSAADLHADVIPASTPYNLYSQVECTVAPIGGGYSQQQDWYLPRTLVSLPYAGADVVNFEGEEAENDFNFNSRDLNIGLIDQRIGTTNSNAASSGYINFVATDSTTTFLISGSYSYTLGFSSALEVYLYDESTSTTVFGNVQYSLSGTQGTLTLGGLTSPGDTLTGARFGTLIQGDEYEFNWNAGTSAGPTNDTGTNAAGDFDISFLDNGNVPEPGTAVLAAAAFATFSVLGRRGTRPSIGSVAHL